ncbi:MAG: primosomal protein N' [Candidatus Omnitrophica bacterium]|nr:primosomal protein N' [Candidatus Omnitrophota bacterium]
MKRIKPIIELLDINPILDEQMIILCRQIADFYCCSLGEMIETAIPDKLRQAKPIEFVLTAGKKTAGKGSIEVLHCPDNAKRLEYYIQRIKTALGQDKSVILILSDVNKVVKAGGILQKELGQAPACLVRNQKTELDNWLNIKSGKERIVIGTRSAIFAPINSPDLIIMDEEDDPVYKQDQVPHYHARLAALLRVEQGSDLILGSTMPSLESIYLREEEGAKYLNCHINNNTQVQMIDASRQRKGAILTRFMEDAIAESIAAKQKVLIFINRKGFATFAACNQCGFIYKCPRCNINLIYHYKENILGCHYCSYKTEPIKICPKCNAGYIRYSGSGVEKIESEISKIFPQAKIKILGDEPEVDINEADIFVATQIVLKKEGASFDLTGILSIDNTFNRPDFRSTEKAMRLLEGLLAITKKKMIIQTRNPQHHCLTALVKNDPEIFYKEELKERKQLKFPPYSHFILIKIRSPKEERAKLECSRLFETLKQTTVPAGIELINYAAAPVPKLRGNYYWQIMIKANQPKKCGLWIKKHLAGISHSGIIVTVDVDPI